MAFVVCLRTPILQCRGRDVRNFLPLALTSVKSYEHAVGDPDELRHSAVARARTPGGFGARIGCRRPPRGVPALAARVFGTAPRSTLKRGVSHRACPTHG